MSFLSAISYSKGEVCLMVGPDNFYKTKKDNNIFKKWMPIKKWNSGEEDSVNLIKIAKKIMHLISY